MKEAIFVAFFLCYITFVIGSQLQLFPYKLQMHLKGEEMNLYSEIGTLRGIGPKLNEKLNKCGIFTIMDLLLYFPRDYEFVYGNKDIQETSKDEKQILTCTAEEFKRDIRTKTGKTMSTILFKYGDETISAIWFNQPYVRKNFAVGKTYNLLGKYKKNRGSYEVINPLIVSGETRRHDDGRRHA